MPWLTKPRHGKVRYPRGRRVASSADKSPILVSLFTLLGRWKVYTVAFSDTFCIQKQSSRIHPHQRLHS